MRRLPRVAACLAVAVSALSGTPPPAGGSELPSGFRDSVVLGEVEEPTAVQFSSDERVFVSEKAGRILVYDDLEDDAPDVFADLRTEVYDNGDRGLLGLELDPEFPARPYVYALYTYDHLLGEAAAAPRWGSPNHTGDPCPKPGGADVDACPVSGRLVRLTAVGDHAEESAGVPVEKVLLEDWCQQFSSHSIGDIQFGPDGALYASGGDGASFNDADYGQFGWPQKNQCGDPPGAVGDELTPPSAEGGALRSLDARTPSDPTGLDGSLVRIDPESGAGLPGNPMFGSPDPNARRITAYGFRNPFRFAIDPGGEEIYVANVGWNTFEEIDRVAAKPPTPFDSGWPCYEGPLPNPIYQGLELGLCKALYGEPGASASPFFYYRHGVHVIPEDGCSTETGSTVGGLTFYHGGPFPDSYDGALFFADPVRGCIYVMYAGGDGRPDPLSTTTFMSQGGLYPGIDLEIGPDGALYYVKLFGDVEQGTIHRVSFDPDAPVADLTASPEWGAEDPLEVDLDASGSTDPNGDPLSYEWDLDGNGTFAAGDAQRTELFDDDGEGVTVAVRVSDGVSSAIDRVTVYPGDTPPEPDIEAPGAALQWRVGQEIEFAGSAADGEEGDLSDSHLYWKTRLYHCPSACHAHPLQVFPGVDEGSLTAPDHDYPAHIEFSLTATDSRGLSATKSVSVYPRTVDLTIGSDPPGVELSAGLRSAAAPFDLRVIEGSTLVLAAPSSAQLGGGELPWSSWSDGGARVHAIVASESAAYTASYGTGAPLLLDSGGKGRKRRRVRVGLSKHPPKLTHRSTAWFAFATRAPGRRFRCKLDGGSFAPCRSPRVFRHLEVGEHVFRVFAYDPKSQRRSTATVFRWRIACPAVPRIPRIGAATPQRRACARRAGSAGRGGR